MAAEFDSGLVELWGRNGAVLDGADGSARLWDATSGARGIELRGRARPLPLWPSARTVGDQPFLTMQLDDGINFLTFSTDASRLLGLTYDSVRMWDTTMAQPRTAERRCPAVTFSTDCFME